MTYACVRRSQLHWEDWHTLCCAECTLMYILRVRQDRAQNGKSGLWSLTPSTTHFMFISPPLRITY
jgi:hypothetical protein